MAIISQTSLPKSTPDIVLRSVACDSSVLAGDWVRLNGSGVAIKAQANNLTNSNVLGLVEEKVTATLANIRVEGVSEPLFVGLDETKEYFLSSITAGGMVIQGGAIPTGSGEVVLKLGQPFGGTRFLVHKGIRMVRA